MKITNLGILLCLSITLVNCTIYQSPDRKDFESESPSFRTQNLKKVECSNQSLKPLAKNAKLVTVINHPTTNESEFLWELQMQVRSQFESDNLKGAYCVFENN